MEIVHCSFCKHSNPADAKFCNACGSSLALQLCEACGAIDNVSASVCHKCGHPFASGAGVAATDDGETRGVTPAAQAEEPARRGRSPWRLLVLLALIVAGALVIYPRVAGDEARPVAVPAPAGAEADASATANLPVPGAPAGVDKEAAAVESAAEAADADRPSTDAASPSTDTPHPSTDAAPSTSAADAPALPAAAVDATPAKPPAPTATTTESAPGEPLAPTTAAQPTQASAADSPATTATSRQATPAGCSPAVDALGLCRQGFK